MKDQDQDPDLDQDHHATVTREDQIATVTRDAVDPEEDAADPDLEDRTTATDPEVNGLKDKRYAFLLFQINSFYIIKF